MQLTIPVNQGNINFGQKVEYFGPQKTGFKVTDQSNLRREELSREQTRTREESFRRLQCEQSRTAHVINYYEGRIKRLMRLDQKREWSNRKLEETQLKGNQAWQDSRKAVHQGLKRQMFLNSDERRLSLAN